MTDRMPERPACDVCGEALADSEHNNTVCSACQDHPERNWKPEPTKEYALGLCITALDSALLNWPVVYETRFPKLSDIDTKTLAKIRLAVQAARAALRTR